VKNEEPQVNFLKRDISKKKGKGRKERRKTQTGIYYGERTGRKKGKQGGGSRPMVEKRAPVRKKAPRQQRAQSKRKKTYEEILKTFRRKEVSEREGGTCKSLQGKSCSLQKKPERKRRKRPQQKKGGKSSQEKESVQSTPQKKDEKSLWSRNAGKVQ